ncbi:MAG: HAMP domain-containing histidine kinase, partial [Pedobacter sp.]
MGALIRSMDWSKTPLGPIERWPQSLRTSVSLCLSSTFPILIAWGPETIQIYNDSYRPICGAMHPQSMGMNFRICWESALEVVGDKFTRGQQGEGTYIQDQQMFLQRYGYLEEAYMTFSFAPIRDESGGIGGIFHPITETTDKMLSARRTQVLRDLGAALSRAKSIEDIGRETEGKYADFMNDLPFILFYSYDEALRQAKLVSASGTTAATQLALPIINLESNEAGQWPLLNLLESKEPVIVNELSQRFGDFSCEPYSEAPHTAVVQGIYISGQQLPIGFLVAGVSARRALDEAYLGFYSLLANTYNTAVSNVYAYEQEQKRAEALAEIDRSKTTFFSNVSHEFRTPLTLMLGPLEELLSHRELSDDVKDSIGATHRNALRLLKLVNNLLDYSRVEAGRVQAAFQPLDLAELTVDLASSFRSIIEKAGMQLLVNCQPIVGATYVDRQMWEKIVLNLLSNAFKYTLQGTIEVSLQQEQHAAVLRITDTGVGIPEKELPHMFERF